VNKKYLEFEEYPSKTKTKIYIIYAIDGYYSLGKIKYFSGWQKYCFYSSVPNIVNSNQLREIATFLDKLNK